MASTKFDINNKKIHINEEDYDILFTFDCEQTMKTYIGYTNHTIASNGRKKIYISAYNPKSTPTELEDVTDEKELALVGKFLESIDKENNN